MSVELAAPGSVQSEERFFGKFVLLRSINKGGMGILWVAYDTQASRLVALKQRRAERGGNAATRFADEIKIGLKLSHPHLAKSLEAGTIDGQDFLSLEWIDGQDALSLVERCTELKRDLPLPIAAAIVLQIAEALAYAHTVENFVHRDVTPANIMVGYDGSARLVDYGLAQSNLKEARTLQGRAVGTVGFLAPEQREGSKASPAADLFSLGATLQYLLAGVPQVSEGEDAGSKDAMRRRVGQFVDLPDSVLTVLWRALQRDPAKRYESASELARSLRNALPEPVATEQQVAAFVDELFGAERRAAKKEATSWHARFGNAGALPRGEGEPTITLGQGAVPATPRGTSMMVVGALTLTIAVGVAGALLYATRSPTASPTLAPPSPPTSPPAPPSTPAPAPPSAPSSIEPITVAPLPSPAPKSKPSTPAPSSTPSAPPPLASSPAVKPAATPTSPEELKRKIAEARELASRGQSRLATEKLEALGSEPSAVLALADLLLDQGQYDRAASLASRASKLGAGVEALYVRGSAELLAGNPSDAARDFRKVLDAKPDHADAKQGLARAEKMLSTKTP